MNLHTEKEIFSFNHFHAYRLKQLYAKKRSEFKEISQYLPFHVYLNDKNNLDPLSTNLHSEKFLGDKLVQFEKYGHDFIKEISDPNLLNITLEKVKNYERKADPLSVCSYLQKLYVSKHPSFILTEKIYVDKDCYLNIGYEPQQFGTFGKIISQLLSEIDYKPNGWERIQSLTKQEKKITSLLANGMSNKDVADALYISPHTLKTHRKNIYKKLNIKNFRDLLQYAQVMDIL